MSLYAVDATLKVLGLGWRRHVNVLVRCRCTQWMLGEGLVVGVRGHVNVRVRCGCTQWMLR